MSFECTKAINHSCEHYILQTVLIFTLTKVSC